PLPPPSRARSRQAILRRPPATAPPCGERSNGRGRDQVDVRSCLIAGQTAPMWVTIPRTCWLPTVRPRGPLSVASAEACHLAAWGSTHGGFARAFHGGLEDYKESWDEDNGQACGGDHPGQRRDPNRPSGIGTRPARENQWNDAE